jgi:hypothetical protein
MADGRGFTEAKGKHRPEFLAFSGVDVIGLLCPARTASYEF